MRGPWRRAAPWALGAAVGLAWGLAGGPAAAASGVSELRRVESVGVVPIRKHLRGVPRDAAVKAAVQAALLRVAHSLLPEDFVPPQPPPSPEGEVQELPEPDAWLEEQLGDDPFAYTVRFSILEDRGARPAVFASDAGVAEEYVVVAEVQLDVTAIRKRLAQVGAIAVPRADTAHDLRLEVQGLRSYPPLAALREALLASPDVLSVLPVEFTRQHVVLAVRAEQDADALVADLQHRAPAGLHVVPVETGPDGATVLVDWTASADASGSPPAGN